MNDFLMNAQFHPYNYFDWDLEKLNDLILNLRDCKVEFEMLNEQMDYYVATNFHQ